MSQKSGFDRELGILKQAERRVPALKYAYGLIGIAAAATVVIGLVGNDFSAVISIGFALLGTMFVFCFCDDGFVWRKSSRVCWCRTDLVGYACIYLRCGDYAVRFGFWPTDSLDERG